MPGRGVQFLPLTRIPETWDAKWFANFIRDVLAFADTRNAIEGSGITITGQPDQNATISASDDLQNLLLQTFVLAEPSGFLSFERVLDGESGVVTITDNGANDTIEVRIAVNGINLGKLQQLSGYGILGNPTNTAANVSNIQPVVDKAVVHLDGSTIEFDVIDHSYISDFDTAAADAATAALDAVTFITEADETAGLPASRRLIAGTNVTFDVSVAGELEISSSGGGGSSVDQTTQRAYFLNAATPANFGISTGNSGTSQTPTLAATDAFTRQPRNRWITTTSANQVAGTRADTLAEYSMMARGFTQRVICGTTSNNSGQRVFIGLTGATNVNTVNGDPSAQTDIAGFAKDAADTNLQFMHNDSSGTATKVDLGITWGSLNGALLSAYISAPIGGASITYRLYNHNTQADVATGTVSTDIPGTGVVLGPKALVGNAASGAVVGLEVSVLEILGLLS